LAGSVPRMVQRRVQQPMHRRAHRLLDVWRRAWPCSSCSEAYSLKGKGKGTVR
jgi:hypothetical protein